MTIFNVPKPVIEKVSQQLRRRYIHFDELLPANSLKWLLQNSRNFQGIINLGDIVIDKNAAVFLYEDSFLNEKNPDDDSIRITIKDGAIILSMKSKHLENMNIIHEEKKESNDYKLIPVSEIVFTA